MDQRAPDLPKRFAWSAGRPPGRCKAALAAALGRRGPDFLASRRFRRSFPWLARTKAQELGFPDEVRLL